MSRVANSPVELPQGVEVKVVSRKLPRAEGVCHRISRAIDGARVTPHASEITDMSEITRATQLVISAGAAGVELLSSEARQTASSVQVLIDLNAVPPAGIGGIEMIDKQTERDGKICYGALGVGGLKMKIHKAAINRLYQSNDQVLDADEIYDLGKRIDA